MTETASTYIATGMSTYPQPKPVLDAGTLAEAIRVQLRTWVTVEFGITVPAPEMGTARPADSTAQLLGEITEHVHLYGVEADGDAEPWGIAHLLNAHADSLYAARGHGDAYLLGALYSLIAARAHLRDGYEGRIELDPFGGDRRTVNERALIETARVQIATWAPEAFGTVVQLPERWEMRCAADRNRRHRERDRGGGSEVRRPGRRRQHARPGAPGGRPRPGTEGRPRPRRRLPVRRPELAGPGRRLPRQTDVGPASRRQVLRDAAQKGRGTCRAASPNPRPRSFDATDERTHTTRTPVPAPGL
ncbi:hypothetical protein ACFY91_34595 [Streptomyces albogriseolus]|uniref:hypothetical protein n=1 Tax=Streptomyces albogriseolus TaxID=1887 RepID=UPI0036EC5429